MSFSIEPVRQAAAAGLTGVRPNAPAASSSSSATLASANAPRPAVVYQPAPPQATEPTTYTVPHAAQPVSAIREARLETEQSGLRTFTPPQERMDPAQKDRP